MKRSLRTKVTAFVALVVITVSMVSTVLSLSAHKKGVERELLARSIALSEAQAKSVVDALTSKHGIAASRLSAYGVGPLAPVSTNETEAGRIKNRRIELIKR